MDVHPDGESRILAEGILRARFRDGFEQPRPVEPGAVHAYSIDLVATANVFAAGHRVRVAITSSSFPRFDPQPEHRARAGRGRPRRPAARPADDLPRPGAGLSHILLPVIPR